MWRRRVRVAVVGRGLWTRRISREPLRAFGVNLCMAFRRRFLFLPGALLIAFTTGCGPRVDLSRGLQVEIISTGWSDGGIVDGKHKLVPSVSFRLTNVSDQRLSMLQVNAMFRRVSSKDEWGSGLVTAAGADSLRPAATTGTLTINSQLGYTGDESREAMLDNSRFVDATVDLFAKYGSTQWARLGEYPISRHLVAP